MILSAPFIITPRLLPGLQFGAGDSAGWISIGYAHGTGALLNSQHSGRQSYRYYIDMPGGAECSDDDLSSGQGGGDLQAGMASLLSFIGAAIESRQYRNRQRFGERADIDPDSNETLFPAAVLDWAEQFADEISTLAWDLEVIPGMIQE